MLETWKAVPGYEGVYEVSDKGNCRRLTDYMSRPLPAPRPLKPRADRRGYVYLQLSLENKKKLVTIHSLVAAAFLGKRPEGWHTAHLDGNPGNNGLENLKYVTPTENEAHKAAHGTRRVGEQCSFSKLTEDNVREIRATYQRGKRGFGGRTLGKRFGVDPRAISHIISGRNWSSLT